MNIENEIAAIKKALPVLERYACSNELDISGLYQDRYDDRVMEALFNLYKAAKSIAEKV